MSRLNNQIKKYNVTIPKLFESILKLNQEQQEKVLKYTEELLFEDKRKGVRKACNIPVNYTTRNQIFVGQIKNISKTGIFIETHQPLIIGEEISMSFNMQGYDRSIKIKGEIAYVNLMGAGVVYKEISHYIAEMIESLIERL
jgi:Tfp pilus assembly protein PilZ